MLKYKYKKLHSLRTQAFVILRISLSQQFKWLNDLFEYAIYTPLSDIFGLKTRILIIYICDDFSPIIRSKLVLRSGLLLIKVGRNRCQGIQFRYRGTATDSLARDTNLIFNAKEQ